MGFFKKKVDKEIDGPLWGCLTNVHKVDVDTISREMRCVERGGMIDGEAVTFVRVFKPGMATEKGVSVTGWETFDQHPELVLFEGHVTRSDRAFLTKRSV